MDLAIQDPMPEQEYTINSKGEGRCYLCDVTLTSHAHKGQHVEGKKHKVQRRLWLMRRGSTNQVPLAIKWREDESQSEDEDSVTDVNPWRCVLCQVGLNTRRMLKLHLKHTPAHQDLTKEEIKRLIQQGEPRNQSGSSSTISNHFQTLLRRLTNPSAIPQTPGPIPRVTGKSQSKTFRSDVSNSTLSGAQETELGYPGWTGNSDGADGDNGAEFNFKQSKTTYYDVSGGNHGNDDSGDDSSDNGHVTTFKSSFSELIKRKSNKTEVSTSRIWIKERIHTSVRASSDSSDDAPEDNKRSHSLLAQNHTKERIYSSQKGIVKNAVDDFGSSKGHYMPLRRKRTEDERASSSNDETRYQGVTAVHDYELCKKREKLENTLGENTTYEERTYREWKATMPRPNMRRIVDRYDECDSETSPYDDKRGSKTLLYDDRCRSKRSLNDDRRSSKRSLNDDRHGSKRSLYDDRRGSKRSLYDDRRGSKRSLYDDRRGSKASLYDDRHGSKTSLYDDGRGSKASLYDDRRGSTTSLYDDRRGSKRSLNDDRYGSKASLYVEICGSKRSLNDDRRESKRSLYDDRRGSKRSLYDDRCRSERSLNDDRYGSKTSLYVERCGSKRSLNDDRRESKRSLYDDRRGSKRSLNDDRRGPKRSLYDDRRGSRMSQYDNRASSKCSELNDNRR